MIAQLTRWAQVPGGMVGTLVLGDRWYVSLEREWLHNLPFMSCVPQGVYDLVPHHGEKYPDTFALVGLTVGAAPSEHKPRYACVLHGASGPRQLQGCIALGYGLSPRSHLVGYEAATRKAIEYLHAEPGPHRLVIGGPYG